MNLIWIMPFGLFVIGLKGNIHYFLIWKIWLFNLNWKYLCQPQHEGCCKEVNSFKVMGITSNPPPFGNSSTCSFLFPNLPCMLVELWDLSNTFDVSSWCHWCFLYGFYFQVCVNLKRTFAGIVPNIGCDLKKFIFLVITCNNTFP